MNSSEKLTLWVVTIITAAIVALGSLIGYYCHADKVLFIENGYEQATFEGTSDYRWQK